MPFDLNDNRGVSASSHFYDERQVGLWKSKAMHDAQRMDSMLPMPSSNSVASSPMENTIWAQDMKLPEIYQARDLKENLGASEEANKTSWKPLDHQLRLSSNLNMQPESNSLDGKRIHINGTQYESSLFSCSLSEIFSRKMRLSANTLCPPPSNAVASCHEKEPVESLKEIEVKTIGNLLPDEEDLFSGMTDELGYSTKIHTCDDIEDFDLFSSGGGMELEGSDLLRAMQKKSGFIGGISSCEGVTNGSFVGEHPYGEDPSRTLFVRNINSNVEDSELKSIFEQYGDIRTLYTACKLRGFVMVSYYDLRAAQNAMRALQNKSLGHSKLDIHYSIPKDNPSEKDVNQGVLVVFNVEASVSNEELCQIFGIYGEIKEICESPHTHHQKFIEFYDIRATETALRALCRISIAGKQIKLEPSRPGGAVRLVQLSVQEQGEHTLSCSPCDSLSSGRMVLISPVAVTSGLDSCSAKSLHSAIRSPVSAFPHQSSSIKNTLSSPVRMASLNTKFDLSEPIRSFDEMKFQSQYIPSFHPHSLPEIHDGLANGNLSNLSNIVDLAGTVRPGVIEGINNRHIQRVATNGHPIEFNRGVFGPSGNGNCPPHGHQYVWSNSNSYQHHPPSPVMWSNSPSFSTSIHAHRFQQMAGFPRAPPHMLNTAAHHVGSAPAVNPSLWNRGHAFSGESPEASNFHLGSLGNAGFASGSPLQSGEIASHTIFSHVGGNCLDMTANTPQQMCHIFPGGNPMMSMQASFGSPNEHPRSFSYRRNEANSNHADKKQYELDVDRIMCGEDTRTTLMIKNIPNKYTSKMLLAAIDEHYRGSYDFIYLPIDFKNKCNVGYAFINMVDPRKIIPFYQAFNGKKWEKFNSEKVACLAYARIQGKAALIAHFQNSSLMNEDKRCRPILFHTAGPNAGDQEPFPMGSNIRSRPGKARSSINEQGNLFTFADGEESCNGTDSSSSGSLKNSD